MTAARPTHWKELHATRHDWATRAYDAFMASLSDDVRERLGHKPAEIEANVVVFGPTQVGKTTLLMDLMGVAPDALARVLTVLRGGRNLGCSATATAMEYRRSPDQRWGLGEEPTVRWFETDTEMAAALGELRASMEERRLAVTDPRRVWIPADGFAEDAQQPRVRMFDLPGDQPANAVEQEHVHAMAGRYVPRADLILLVGLGDDLSFLQPGRLTLPGIENWQRMPERFRIVITHFFQAQTMQDMVRDLPDDEPVTVDALRERLIGQIEIAHPLAPRARQPRRFFPFEVGDSWRHASVQKPNLYARVSPVIDALRQELLDDIRASTGRFARLKGAMLAHQTVQEVFAEAFARLEAERHAKAKEVKARKPELMLQYQAAMERFRSLKALRGRLVELDRGTLRMDALNAGKWPDDPVKLADVRSVSSLRRAVAEVRFSLKGHFASPLPPGARKSGAPVACTSNDLPQVRRKFWQQRTIGDRSDALDEIFDEAFQSLLKRLKGYVLDKYWFTDADTSDYQVDRRLFKTAVDQMQREVQKTLAGWWMAAAGKELDRLAAEVTHKRHALAAWRADVTMQRATLAALQQDEQRIATKVEELKRRADTELVESKRFARMLNEHYLDELRRRRHAIATSGSPARRLTALLAAAQLPDARGELQRDVEHAPD